MTGNDVDQLVAVVYPPLGVRHHQPVAIAVQRNAQIRAMGAHCVGQRLGMRGAAFIVDIEAVRLVADGDHLGPQLVQDVRGNVIGRAIGAVDHDPHAAQVEVLGKVLLQNSM